MNSNSKCHSSWRRDEVEGADTDSVGCLRPVVMLLGAFCGYGSCPLENGRFGVKKKPFITFFIIELIWICRFTADFIPVPPAMILLFSFYCITFGYCAEETVFQGVSDRIHDTSATTHTTFQRNNTLSITTTIVSRNSVRLNDIFLYPLYGFLLSLLQCFMKLTANIQNPSFDIHKNNICMQFFIAIECSSLHATLTSQCSQWFLPI